MTNEKTALFIAVLALMVGTLGVLMSDLPVEYYCTFEGADNNSAQYASIVKVMGTRSVWDFLAQHHDLDGPGYAEINPYDGERIPFSEHYLPEFAAEQYGDGEPDLSGGDHATYDCALGNDPWSGGVN